LAYLLNEHGGESDEALRYAQKAVELAPEQPAFCDTLGWVLYHKGLYSEAVRYLQRAAASKEDVVWKYHLAMAYAKAGDSARGRSMLQTALRLQPNVPEAKIAEQVLAASH
jgi:Flp pilus assembly protein TadD